MMAYINLASTEPYKIEKPKEEKPYEPKDYIEKVGELRGNANAIGNAEKAEAEYNKKFPEGSGLAPTGISYLDIPYSKAQQFFNMDKPKREAYTNFKNSIENEVIPTILRSEGIPLNAETLNHAREAYNLDNLTPKQVKELLARAKKKIRDDNVFYSNTYKKPNIAQIVSDEEYQQDERSYMENLKKRASDIQRDMPTFNKIVYNANSGDQSATAHDIVQNDVDEVLIQNSGDLQASIGPIYSKMTGESYENPTAQGVGKFVAASNDAVTSRENVSTALFTVLGTVLGGLAITFPELVGPGVLIGGAAYGTIKGGQKYLEKREQGESILSSAASGAVSGVANAAGAIGEARLALSGGSAVGSIVRRGAGKTGEIAANTTRKAAGKRIGDEAPTELAAVSKLQEGSGKVLNDVRGASGEVLKKYSNLTEQEVSNTIQNISKKNPDTAAIINEIEKDFRIRANGGESPAEAIYKTIRDSSSGDTLENLASRFKTSPATARNVLRQVEREVLPEMIPLTEQAAFLSKLRNQQGKNIQPKELASEVNKMKLTDEQKFDLLPELFGSAIDNETFEILKQSSGGTKGLISSGISKVTDTLKALAKGKKITYEGSHLNKVADRLKELIKELGINPKALPKNKQSQYKKY